MMTVHLPLSIPMCVCFPFLPLLLEPAGITSVEKVMDPSFFPPFPLVCVFVCACVCVKKMRDCVLPTAFSSTPSALHVRCSPFPSQKKRETLYQWCAWGLLLWRFPPYLFLFYFIYPK